ncbi:unnamed protein product [Discosporangium mesarthrocarpum]
MALNLGLPIALLGILQLSRQERWNQGMVTQVLDILCVIAEKRRDDVRDLLFPYLSLFLYFISSHTALVAKLIEGITRGDPEIGLSIEDEQLQTIVRGVAQSRETDLLILLQKLVICNDSPDRAMQHRVLVALLQEFSRSNFHAAFGWDTSYSTPISSPSDSLPRPDASPPKIALPPAAHKGSGEGRLEPYHNSGRGFMASLQKALARGSGNKEHDHAIELLKTIACCCRVCPWQEYRKRSWWGGVNTLKRRFDTGCQFRCFMDFFTEREIHNPSRLLHLRCTHTGQQGTCVQKGVPY